MIQAVPFAGGGFFASWPGGWGTDFGELGICRGRGFLAENPIGW
jgi:hypothetical protein